MEMEHPKTATRLHLTKDDKLLKNFSIWKALFKHLGDAHLQYAKNLAELANNAETAFRNDPDIRSHGIMIDIGQVLVNELKSQAQVVKAKWSDYNEEDQPYHKLSQIDGKDNKAMLRAIHEGCTERKAMEHKVKNAQKKFFRAFDQTRGLIEKIDMLESEQVDRKEMLTELTGLKSKTDVYLAKYKSTYQSECDNRQDFIEKMTTLEDRWMAKEKENLETWIETCRDLCHRLDETSPRAFRTPLDEESPYPAVFRKLAHVSVHQLVDFSLKNKIQLHTFPVFKERRMEDITTPPGSYTKLVKRTTHEPNNAVLNSFIVTHTCTNTTNPTIDVGENIDSSPGKQALESGESQERRRPRANRIKHLSVPGETLDTLEERVSYLVPAKETEFSDSDIEVIELDDAKPVEKPKDVKNESKHRDSDNVKSQFTDDEITPRPTKKYNLLQDGSDGSSQPSSDSSVSGMENVLVAVIKEYTKTNKNELDLNIGMHIKQKQCANESGMAYGWYKKNKFGVKKYGYYPVDHVVLLQKSFWVKLPI